MALTAPVKGRKYHLEAVNDQSGRRERVTATPATHQECMTIKSKFNLAKHVRLVLAEVTCSS